MSIVWCRWSFIALIVIQVIWFGWLYPPDVLPQGFVLAVMLGPLLAVSWGVWKTQVRSMVIAGFILLFHFCFAVAEAYASSSVRALALLQILLITIYFIGLLAVRRQKTDLHSPS